ncbi:o-spanin [Caulobacter phage Sansa]|uniref:O-spanin n=1 Tax=Caulobacter phage Sansa TaxID=1675600 RepID=A0A0K1LLT1_9CAUD|nr:o-spanin [Caulobacter phage Sansa]AKU43456.1 o-spanin [Caulobacter phage Sansa]
MPRVLILALASLLLVGCSHLSVPSLRLSATPPPPVVCPALVNAEPQAEPPPPDGFNQDQLAKAFFDAFGQDLGLAVWKWFRADWPAWARMEARAHESAYEFCKDPTRVGKTAKKQ